MPMTLGRLKPRGTRENY